MFLKRTVYHIDGNDYNQFQSVSLNIIAPVISIETIRKILVGNKLSTTIDKETFCMDNRIKCKQIKIKGYACNLYDFLKVIGVKDNSEVRDNLYIRHNEFKKIVYKPLPIRFSCFDPSTKVTKFTHNSPKVINKQEIIHNKLWRKLV
jgi:hypothetical protein